MKKTLILLILCCMAFSHQPRIVEGPGIVRINDPEISQAFYGELNGSPAVFEITSSKEFKLYVGISIPAISNEKPDKSVEVASLDENGNETLRFYLNASQEWKPFYEEFGGDDYLQGPEKRMDAAAGTYIIRVSSPDNKGKYVLAVGEQEAFGPLDTVNAVLLLPGLKSRFFNKSPFDALFTKIYLFAFAPVFALIVLLALSVWAFRKLGSGKNRKQARRRGN